MTARWAFVGAGRHAELWMIPAMAASSNATLIGVWGQHVDKARSLTERYGIPTPYASLEELLSDRDVDAVYVSTPNYLHAQHSVAALRAGKHVLYGGRFPLAKNDIWIYGERGRIGLKEVVDVRTRGTLELTLPEDSLGSIAEVHQPRLMDHYQAELEDFSRCVEEGRAFHASGTDGLRSVEVSEAIIESQRSGGRVTIH